MNHPCIVSRQELRALLAADRARLRTLLGDDPAGDFAVCWRVTSLYRWSNYHQGQGRRALGRLLWHLNVIACGADIPPTTEIGPGLVIVRPLGLTLYCKAGRDLTITGPAAIGAGMVRRDVGAGVGRPLLGDGVTVSAGAVVLGPIRIGDGAHVGPGTVLMADVAAGESVSAPPPRVQAILARGGEHDAA